jgi:hypothetical protein
MRALLLTPVLLLAACNVQAPYAPKSADEIQQLIHIADEAFDVAQKVYAGAPEPEVLEATREVYTALDAARTQTEEILKQVAKVDHLARGSTDPMGVSTCTRAQLMEIEDIDNMSATTKMHWSMEVGKCAAFAIVYFKSAPPADSSVLALVLTIIDPVLLVAKTRAGLNKGALVHYLESNQSVIARFGPQCENTAQASGQVSYQCAAYRVAIAVRPKLRALEQQAQSTP